MTLSLCALGDDQTVGDILNSMGKTVKDAVELGKQKDGDSKGWIPTDEEMRLFVCV